jgi:hypothetical protein
MAGRNCRWRSRFPETIYKSQFLRFLQYISYWPTKDGGGLFNGLTLFNRMAQNKSIVDHGFSSLGRFAFTIGPNIHGFLSVSER